MNATPRKITPKKNKNNYNDKYSTTNKKDDFIKLNSVDSNFKIYDFINTYRPNSKNKILNNLINNAITAEENEFKILSSRLSYKKCNGLNFHEKNMKNLIINSIKDNKLNNSKSKYNNNNLILNSFNSSRKVTQTKKNESTHNGKNDYLETKNYHNYNIEKTHQNVNKNNDIIKTNNIKIKGIEIKNFDKILKTNYGIKSSYSNSERIK